MFGAPAPLYETEGVRAPSGGSAIYLTASDGVRLRVAAWPEGRRGTVVLFQGRTEFIEKYYETIGRFCARDFAVAAIDWRGQGLSDRPLPDRRKGYVADFAHFQRDVDALLHFLRDAQAPKPWLLVGHSMGGAISTRLLMRQDPALGGDLVADGSAAPMAACILSAPMLGLHGSWATNTMARRLAGATSRFGMRNRYTLGCDTRTAADHGFNGNVLTTDEGRFETYAKIITAHDDLALGGPTWGWLRAAYREIGVLRPPSAPILLAIGSDDTVVSVRTARRFVDAAPNAELVLLPGAKHEPFIENDATQDRLWRAIGSFLDAQNI